jgi:hypothetical protein
MNGQMTAIEMTGKIDEHHQLQLDSPLPMSGPMRVRVILLYPIDDDEWDEAEWLRAVASNPAFDYLKDSAEDIYTLNDGKPFDDQI